MCSIIVDQVKTMCVQDLIRFGNSSREYVLLHERSSGEA